MSIRRTKKSKGLHGDLMQQIRELRKDQVARRHEKKEEKKADRAKKMEKAQDKRNEGEEEKKDVMRIAGQKSKREIWRRGGVGVRGVKYLRRRLFCSYTPYFNFSAKSFIFV